MGDSTLHISRIDHLVPVDTPVTEFERSPVQEEDVQRIARYIAGIIDDGSTLQIGLGQVAHEALQYLTDRKDLGVHSDLISDAIIPLLENGSLTGACKTSKPFKIVASMALGSRALYDLIDGNPLFSIEPMDAVCNPITIAAQHKMVAIAQAYSIDLTGQVCIDQFGGEFYGGIGSQGEFLRGASRSPGGKPIVCMTSTTEDGTQSRIRPALLAGEAATIARTDVHYVVTEYGIAYLFGKSIRERATALIELAHPQVPARAVCPGPGAGLPEPRPDPAKPARLPGGRRADHHPQGRPHGDAAPGPVQRRPGHPRPVPPPERSRCLHPLLSPCARPVQRRGAAPVQRELRERGGVCGHHRAA